jgi:hypothetical protein
MAPWTPVAAYKQGEKFSANPTTEVTLGTNDRSLGTQTGTGVTVTLG